MGSCICIYYVGYVSYGVAYMYIYIVGHENGHFLQLKAFCMSMNDHCTMHIVHVHPRYWWSMLTTSKMARKPVKLQKKVQQDALGKVNRVKEIRRREKDGLKINRQKPFVRKQVSRDVSVI